MWRRPIAGIRERMVLGQVRPVLEADERVVVWAHVLAADDGRPGLLSLTPSRCLVHFTTRDEATEAVRLDEITAWRIEPGQEGSARVSLTSAGSSVDVRLPLTSRAQVDRANGVAEHLARFTPERSAAEPGLPFEVERRGLRGQARRVVVTVVGMLVMVLGLLLSSPGVPGPGALVFLAGLAILSREYDWARDAHRWVKRTVERGLAKVRRRRASRDGQPTQQVTRIGVPPCEHGPEVTRDVQAG